MSSAAETSSSLPASARLRPVRLLGDVALSRRAAQGDTAAFGEIYRRHHQAIYRFCRSMLISPEDAGDALHNTMAAALRALPGETRTIDLRPWLFRVARNECVTLLRARRPTADLADLESLPALASDEERVAVRGRLRELVADLQALPERQRSALMMRELSGLQYDDIAVALETTAATAKQAVYEARSALHELAEGRAMSCDGVQRTLSDGDGRTRRGRRLRSHLRACGECNAFALAIGRRRSDLALIAPPLAAPLAGGLLSGLLGVKAGSAGGAGVAGGAIATGTSAAVKGVAVIAATVAVGAGGYGAADRLVDRDPARPAERSEGRAHETPAAPSDSSQSPPVARRRAARAAAPRPARRGREEAATSRPDFGRPELPPVHGAGGVAATAPAGDDNRGEAPRASRPVAPPTPAEGATDDGRPAAPAARPEPDGAAGGRPAEVPDDRPSQPGQPPGDPRPDESGESPGAPSTTPAPTVPLPAAGAAAGSLQRGQDALGEDGS